VPISRKVDNQRASCEGIRNLAVLVLDAVGGAIVLAISLGDGGAEAFVEALPILFAAHATATIYGGLLHHRFQRLVQLLPVVLGAALGTCLFVALVHCASSLSLTPAAYASEFAFSALGMAGWRVTARMRWLKPCAVSSPRRSRRAVA